MQENTCENVVCNKAAILSRPQCVKYSISLNLQNKTPYLKVNTSVMSTARIIYVFVRHQRDDCLEFFLMVDKDLFILHSCRNVKVYAPYE